MTLLVDSNLAVNGGVPVRSKPWPAWPVWDEREQAAVAQVLNSARWGLGGTQIPAFAERFAQYQQAAHAIPVSSGTKALEVALRAAGVGHGDEVIIPSYSFIATASACLEIQAIPVFADIDLDTYTIDPKSAEAMITKRTKALMPVHVAGCPADLDTIVALAKRRGLAVIEDAAQAHGAEWKGRRVGAIGDCGGFSFQSSKNLCAGEGGAVTTDDEALYQRAWSLHNCGRVLGDAGYDRPTIGSNLRITEWQAAILLAQMERLQEQTERRNRNALYLTEQLAQIPGIAPARRDERVTQHAYHLYVFRYAAEAFNGLTRDQFLAALRAEGIPCSPGYSPLYREAAFQEGLQVAGRTVSYRDVSLPNVEQACPVTVWLTQTMLLGEQSDMDDIVEAVAKIHRAVSKGA